MGEGTTADEMLGYPNLIRLPSDEVRRGARGCWGLHSEGPRAGHPYFSQFWRLRVRDLGSSPGPLSLAGRWLCLPRVLTWSSLCVSVSSSPFVRAAVTLDWVRPVTSLHFIHPIKDPACR